MNITILIMITMGMVIVTMITVFVRIFSCYEEFKGNNPLPKDYDGRVPPSSAAPPPKRGGVNEKPTGVRPPPPPAPPSPRTFCPRCGEKLR